MSRILRFFPDYFLTVILPAVFFVCTVVAEQVFHACVTACEDGPAENLQALILLCAFLLGVRLLMAPRGTYPRWARVFFLIGTLGALYACLEEISYGQRIFGWVTPDHWAVINDQDETNLHNTSAWLDQKPRLILEVGVVIGGIIMPLLRRFKPDALPEDFAVVYPDDLLFPTAFFAFGIHMVQLVTEWTHRQDLYIIQRGSEMQETYLFWFILLYFFFKRRQFTSAARGR